MKKRISFIFMISALLLSLLVVRTAWIQFVMGKELQAKAIDSRLRNIDVKAKRGIIYDRNGSPLAISVSADSVYAVPSQVRRSNQLEEIAEALAEVLELNKEDVIEKLNKRIAFEWIKRRIPDEKIKQLKELDLPGINFVEENQRYYPKGKLAAHILGFAGIDNQGLNGVELTFDKELRGASGKIMIEYDAGGREIPNAMHQYIPPIDGNSIYLTIDETIQYVVEREIDQMMKIKQAKKAAVLVMDVKTGDILGMASRPVFDPNNYAEYDQGTWRNFALTDAYEPGSTFKPVVAAGAMEENIVKATDRFYDPGYIKVGKETIKCWSRTPHGSQSFIEGVQNSCNPVFVTVGLRMGKDNFYKYLNGFGFGAKTGIDLPGEATGILVPRSRTKDIDLATMSIGQANAVTPIQLVRAVAAIANDGWLMKPQLVKEIRDFEGKLVRELEPEPIRQVISQQTSKELRDILESVVTEGTGRNAYLEGYKVAGKTGTAQKILPGGGYSSSEYIASFVGFAPADEPRIAVLVVVDAPQGVYYGGQVAAPVFKNVILDSLRYLEVPPELKNGVIIEEKKITVPDIKTKNIAQATKELKALGFKVQVEGQGEAIITQLPPAGTEISKGSNVVLYTQDSESNQIVVPDLTGRTIKEASKILSDIGLGMAPQGSGLAALQEPYPGTKVDEGTVIKIQFLSPNVESHEETIGP
ncbi:MAG: stage V sporulation protein D [Peptococcaceae bacterium BICA1-8]|nr:MAG: stage V sporulation protein D [Peptococcaceae bacterium BICA1-8]